MDHLRRRCSPVDRLAVGIPPLFSSPFDIICTEFEHNFKASKCDKKTHNTLTISRTFPSLSRLYTFEFHCCRARKSRRPDDVPMSALMVCRPQFDIPHTHAQP